jgi:hypothetical protein
MVLSVQGGAISAITGFPKPELYPYFDLPEELDAQATAGG